MLLGSGTIRRVDNDHVQYDGTFPCCEDGEKVYTVREKDLALIMRAEEMILLRTPFRMSKAMLKDFPDELDYTAKDGTQHKLFLDRHFYAANPRDMMWVRYVSVDQSFIEEQP